MQLGRLEPEVHEQPTPLHAITLPFHQPRHEINIEGGKVCKGQEHVLDKFIYDKARHSGWWNA